VTIVKSSLALKLGLQDDNHNNINKATRIILKLEHTHTISKAMRDEQPPLEIEVLKWDAHSFTIEGTNDQLEKLLKEKKVIRTLSLRHHGQMGRLSRDVRLRARRDFTSEVEGDSGDPPIQGTTFEYEGLD
jgi:hypothetical protein